MLSPLDGLFLFGRVIRSDLPRDLASMPGAYLIYVYGFQASDVQSDRAELRPDALLLSPLFINRMPWTKGYFQNVATWPLTEGDLVRQHCFLSGSRGLYFDESFNPLPGPVAPCGVWGLNSYRTLDDVSEALLLARFPNGC